jgi:ribosomal protein L23
MNPKGLKYTITSNFPKTGEKIDFVNLKCILVRSDKTTYDNNRMVKFQIDKNLSKPELKQYLQKLYNIEPKRISTAILPGKITMKATELERKGGKKYKMNYIRRPDKKKALVELDFDFHNFYSKMQPLPSSERKSKKEKKQEDTDDSAKEGKDQSQINFEELKSLFDKEMSKLKSK